ncbi:hypothetical protein QR97_38755 [Streptomyces sp. PBH53]|uniref:winged helix DNA-binding domain-containing protein n=1 Tax=Streptomyces sp. PBH53 TaxID=1577075 RepID=UPI0006555A32|nr:winged helix DNA-binding domain-containing protein [Streptomyces sp. PBH53]AKN74857.1 hypothetical protein QR97_38755 [Streptomyces sp. PBH53]
MSTAQGPVLSARALNRALIHRQLLAQRSTLSPAQAITHLVGLQAQAPNPPYIGLWTRLADFAVEDLAALVRERKAVRIALMRSTIHLVTDDDCLALRPLLAEMLARTVKGQFGRQVAGLDTDEIAKLGTELAEARTLTFAELGALMAERWAGYDANALAQTVRNLVPLVQVPPRGLWGHSGQAAHTTAERWLGRGLDTNASIDTYVRRYLAAFGPASVKDMQKWSGLTRLREAFTRLGPALRTYRDETGTVLYDLDGAQLPDPAEELPARYLPEFDNILLSHADRERIMAPEYRPRVFTSNGIIRATFLIDGFVRGLWRIDRVKEAATLVVQPFAPLARRDVAELTEEGERLLSFAASEAGRRDIRFEPVG